MASEHLGNLGDMTPRLVSAAALLAALAAAAPVALAADPTPPTGDQSPSYGGNPPPPGDQSPSYGGNPSSGDTTAPFLRATMSTRHLTTVAKTGKLKLSMGTNEASVVALA